MRVVIVGGGFGGVKLAANLANYSSFDVTLISDKDYFEYHAALYRTATGRSPLEVAIHLKDFFGYAKNVEVIKDKITTIKDTAIQGESGEEYAYDKLIMAVGNVTSYFGIKGLEEFSYGIKSVPEALELKQHIHNELTKDGNEPNYVIIGGGPTGIELAAELTAYIRHIRRNHKDTKPYKIALVELQPHILPSLPHHFSRQVETRLKALGVHLILNVGVQGESASELKLPGGEIKSRTVIWTAGVANNPIFKAHPDIFTLEHNGKVKVDDYLHVNDRIIVIGDGAQTKYSGMAQTALHDANFVAANLIREYERAHLKRYKPKKPIFAIPVGPKWSATRIGKHEFFGYSGWIIRRLADLKLYLTLLPIQKSFSVWNLGNKNQESCPVCRNN